MEAILINSDFEAIGFLDVFESFLWVDRYDKCGDFELVLLPDSSIVSTLINSSYLAIKESEHIMIIEDINIHTDAVDGNRIIIKGRSSESILDRRIVWDYTILTGDLQDSIELLLTENIINPTDTDRIISNFEFLASADTAITALEIEAQYFGNNLYNIISDICINYGIGFKVTLTALNAFKFELYSGKDRSYDQSTNPYIVFSPKYDNLLNSDFTISTRFYKTIALVSGESGIGNVPTIVEVPLPGGSGVGLDRKETFKDASDLTRTSSLGTLSEQEYQDQLYQRGLEELSLNSITQSFEGQIENYSYIYGSDFYLGDILQIENEYGNSSKSRISEIIYFQDSSGISIRPTFTKVI